MTPRRERRPDPVGATPLTDEDLEGLVPTDVATRGDLDRAELENIVEARTWAAGRTWKPDTVLDSHTLADLHRRMFGQVWRWAGKWRNRETSIGIAPELMRSLGQPVFTWSQRPGVPPDRKRYREALQAMDRDREDVTRLLKFARG